jgi:hypothetical protein
MISPPSKNMIARNSSRFIKKNLIPEIITGNPSPVTDIIQTVQTQEEQENDAR